MRSAIDWIDGRRLRVIDTDVVGAALGLADAVRVRCARHRVYGGHGGRDRGGVQAVVGLVVSLPDRGEKRDVAHLADAGLRVGRDADDPLVFVAVAVELARARHVEGSQDVHLGAAYDLAAVHQADVDRVERRLDRVDVRRTPERDAVVVDLEPVRAIGVLLVVDRLGDLGPLEAVTVAGDLEGRPVDLLSSRRPSSRSRARRPVPGEP